jgi:hypothetical protein
VAQYGYKNRHVQKFIRRHFPPEYRPHAKRIYPDYRNSLVHAWNLFGEAALLPGNESIQMSNGTLEFGLLNFVEAFEFGVDDFLTSLETDGKLQSRSLYRYRQLTEQLVSRNVSRTLVIGAIGFAIGFVAGIFSVLVVGIR